MRTVINTNRFLRHAKPAFMTVVMNVAKSVAMTVAMTVTMTALLATAAARPAGAEVPAGAATSYFSTRSILSEFFPKSERVTYRTVVLDAALAARLTARLGYPPPATRYTIFLATTAGHLDGYAIIDEQPGEHQPITFATKLSPAGVVEQVEIVAYREPRGDEVRDPRFRAQFVGKTARDPLRLNRDIDAVTGATISSAATTVVVHRAAVLVEELMLGHRTVASAVTPASLRAGSAN